MTNVERKIKAVEKKGIYTVEQMDKFEEQYKMRPANTIPEWNKLGFSINKGEKVACWTKYWVKFDRLSEEEQKKVEKTFETDDGTKLAQVFAGIFTLEQVHPTYADYSTKQDEMIKFLKPAKKTKKKALK